MTSAVIELGKAAIALNEVPSQQRKHREEILDEKYSLLDSALMLIIRRLGDILLLSDNDKTQCSQELSAMDNFQEWEQLERSVRLCRSLREIGREMEAVQTKLKDKMLIKDRDALIALTQHILREGEGSLTELISRSLSSLSTKLSEPGNPDDVYRRAVSAVRGARDILKNERRRLFESQLEFYKII